MESPVFFRYDRSCKVVLRYIPRMKKWAVYRIYTTSGKPACGKKIWYYDKKYACALAYFDNWVDRLNADKSKIERIRPIVNEE